MLYSRAATSRGLLHHYDASRNDKGLQISGTGESETSCNVTFAKKHYYDTNNNNTPMFHSIALRQLNLQKILQIKFDREFLETFILHWTSLNDK